MKATPKEDDNKHAKAVVPRWQAANPSKRWFETFCLIYGIVWIAEMATIVAFEWYLWFEAEHYMITGIIIITPTLVVPAFFGPKCDRGVPFWDRYWVKATIWIWILTFIGNYFWTHYFYTVLGAYYTFPAHMLNKVPFALFLITHAYFLLYHTFSNMALRRFYSTRPKATIWRFIQVSVLIFAMSYFVAFMETWTIQKFPYYVFKDKQMMYLVGSVCYGIYFIVSFPMFFRVDETPGDKWTSSRAAIDAFGGCMIVTLLLDFWRLYIGSIHSEEFVNKVPWL